MGGCCEILEENRQLRINQSQIQFELEAKELVIYSYKIQELFIFSRLTAIFRLTVNGITLTGQQMRLLSAIPRDIDHDSKFVNILLQSLNGDKIKHYSLTGHGKSSLTAHTLDPCIIRAF
jgi:hypothetical protein